ncbi:MAG: diguanylate cyclase, partial [Nitrospinae bacterium]|nr:diguanylate cyclase [Nitrospinota bacterium]
MSPLRGEFVPRILVVDDVVENIRILQKLLADQGSVVFARDGAGALALVEKNRPDLILLDVRMPGMDGFEVCRILKGRSDTADIPVIFVTGADGEADEVAGLEMGAIDYIRKPFAATVVRARVRNQLALIEAMRQIRRMNAELERLAITDPLTGAFNRRHFSERAHSRIAEARERGLPLSLALFDLDHFKGINDRYGHDMGDHALVTFTDLCQRHVADDRLFSRLGGEEFGWLAPGASLDETVAMADTIRGELAAVRLWQGDEPFGLTVSVGVATLADGDDDFVRLF